jgi:pyruvate/2-oxoglutarate dehydrogenase complex dihydrolipoamide dehydrogenase (E3) component
VRERFDVIVIGMGPGGEEVAEQLAAAGLAVAGVEKSLVGGECPYWGCIPSKTIIRAANALAEGRRIPGLAGGATITPDWAPVARKLREQITDNWDDKVAVERFEGKGGHFFRGHGRLSGQGKVQVGDAELEATRAIVINTGTEPAVPPIPGLDSVEYWTNREAIETDRLPGSLLVMGGGAIGVELSHAFARFGVKVTVVEAASRLLSVEDPEASELLAHVFEREGIEVLTGSRVESVAKSEGGGTRLNLAGGRSVEAERLLVATGRRPNLRDLGLETVGLDPAMRILPVDDHLRVAPGIWGIGDITGKGAFTHVSVYQARIAIADILRKPTPPADYSALPRVTFTDPEIGAVGLTEAQAREKGIRVRSGSIPLSATTRGFLHGPGNDGFIKLIEDADRGVLVGGSTAGPSGGEMISMLSVAVAAGVPTERLRHMIWAYPTFHRGIEGALQALGEPAMEAVT